jgi:hypothetical protein
MTVSELKKKCKELPLNLDRLAIPDMMNVVTVSRDIGFCGMKTTTQLICDRKGEGMPVQELLDFLEDVPDDELIIIKTIRGKDIFDDELIAYGENKGSFRYI